MAESLIHPKTIYGSFKVSGPIIQGDPETIRNFILKQQEVFVEDKIKFVENQIKQLFTDGWEPGGREHDVQDSKGEQSKFQG